MSRIARVVLPGYAHMVMQRGRNNQTVFSSSAHYQLYKQLLREMCERWKVEVLGYCLLPNMVYVLAVPSTLHGLARAMAETNRQFARQINNGRGKLGLVWHARFSSFAMEKQSSWPSLVQRMIDRMPLDNGLVNNLQAYPWSSYRSRRADSDCDLVASLVDSALGEWNLFLLQGNAPADVKIILAHLRTGRPLGSPVWIKELETRLGRCLHPRKRGRKPKKVVDADG